MGFFLFFSEIVFKKKRGKIYKERDDIFCCVIVLHLEFRDEKQLDVGHQ
jgi:hypothetical protein